jgi:membrane protease YdiL (CAAX protease family)
LTERIFEWNSIRQLRIWEILLAFILPSAIGFLGFHLFLPKLVKSGIPSIVAWPIIASTTLSIFVLTGFILVVLESRKYGLKFLDRMCIKKVSKSQWIMTIAGVLVILLISGPLSKVSVFLMDSVGFTVPEYMPFFLNPAVNPMTISLDQLTPGINIKGQFWIIPLFLLTLFLNILAEDLYFRAWLLPKMGRLKRNAWFVNGFLFACYHTFQIWLFPVLLIPSCFLAFLTQRTKSILPSFAVHLLINFALAGIMMSYLVMK